MLASQRRRCAHDDAHGPHPQHPFHRHRRRRYGRHRRGAAELGLRGQRHRLEIDERDGTVALARRARRRRPCGRASRRCGRRRRVERRRGGQSRDRGGPCAPHSRRSPRRDAGGAHALPLRHRDRRYARQDDDHQPDRQRARGSAGRSDVRDRRPARERQRQRQARPGASISSPKPTKATLRSCTCSR